MMREGLRSVLETYSTVQIVGEAQDGEEALALVESLRPYVVVMDISMPKLNGSRRRYTLNLAIQPAGLSGYPPMQMATTMKR